MIDLTKKKNPAKLTTAKLHKIIQKEIGVLSSKYSPSQRINRTTYDVNPRLIKGFYVVFSTTHLESIIDSVKESGIRFDDTQKQKGFIKIPVIQ